MSESPLPASGTAMFAIGPIDDHRCEDRIYVEGTVQNTGSRASKDVKVWVEGLDAAGAVVARDEAMPDPQEIAPGDRGRFIVKLPNDPAIRTFHVEAIGR